MKPRVKLLITDLDNTLYDWVTFFGRSFAAMIDGAKPILGTDADTLLDDLKIVHQRHRNSEQPFALLETAVARAKFPEASRAELLTRLRPAFDAFNEERRRTLVLYPKVRETLEAIRASGCAIAGHTEATVVNATWRLKTLQIDSLISRLYAPEISGDGHPDPKHPTYASYYQGAVRLLGPNERKPAARVLLDICNDHGAKPDESLYVGDSLSRDIGMAKEAGVWAAWAKYGLGFDPAMWNQVVRITHWTSEDVERTQRAAELYGHIVPKVVLNEGYYELLGHFAFGAPHL
jgi:phosphoglycolate phosphatase-like HAD superfamily hydrolase